MPQKIGVPLFAALLTIAASKGWQVSSRTPAQGRKSAPPPAASAAPQSKHFPILLLAFGSDPKWSLRIAAKGPERLERELYPPITLEPAEVTREGVTGEWTYSAKDGATGALVSVHLSREACADAKSGTKGTFKAVVNHTQLGTYSGCARIAPELFPNIYNHSDDEKDEDKKPAQTETVTKFQQPVAVSYLNAARKVVFRRGQLAAIVAPEGSQLSVSRDGKRLLYMRDSKDAAGRAIVLYDSATSKSGNLIPGEVQQPFWSPDDLRVAFLKFVEGHWRLWMAPVAAPDSASEVFPKDIAAIDGWVDAHTILVDDLQQLSWVDDQGAVKQTLALADLGVSGSNTVRVHPLNPDLLLVSAEIRQGFASAALASASASAPGAGFFLYEIRSRRRVRLSPTDLLVRGAEWSRDGLQIYFTGIDASKRMGTYRVFWDGTGLKRYLDGTNLVIGQ
jgi:uncharacterized membrane protein